MALINATDVDMPMFTEQSNVYHAEDQNVLLQALSAGRTGITPKWVDPFTDVEPGKVMAQTSPNMSVRVVPFLSVIQGRLDLVAEGAYGVRSRDYVDIDIPDADDTQVTQHYVATMVANKDYGTGGTEYAARVGLIPGAPGAGPPDIPTDATYHIHATVSVRAQATSVLDSDISDSRLVQGGLGGVIWCSSLTRPQAGQAVQPLGGMTIYEIDTGRMYVWSSGAWNLINPDVTTQFFTDVSYQTVPNGGWTRFYGPKALVGLPGPFTMVVEFSGEYGGGTANSNVQMQINDESDTNISNDFAPFGNAATWRVPLTKWGKKQYPANAAPAFSLWANVTFGDAEIKGWVKTILIPRWI